MSDAILRTENLHRVYQVGGENVHAVNNVNLTIEQQRITAIVGRSGAGKTTLLNLLAGLDTPTQGTVYIEGQDLFAMPEARRIALRRERIGFVFQSFGLLPLLSAAENVGVPLRMRSTSRREREARVTEALEWVGLRERARHRPYELSGGEQQRVSLARALVAQPHIILADEPTGQLDSRTGQRVLEIMRNLCTEKGITMVLITHDPLVMAESDIVHEMLDGAIVETRHNHATLSR
ncbi:MAG: ABC transporter ATP-binding protein [Anaerolineae bacterium]